MSNLGAYQKMTWLAKRVGGPVALGLITAGIGYITGKAGEVGIKKAYKTIKGKVGPKTMLNDDSQIVFEVLSYGKDNEGVEFNVGDKFKVLESDGDAMLVEILGNENNPYFVSREFLQKISNFTN